MSRHVAALLLAGCIAACSPVPPPPDTAQLPPGVFGPQDQDIPAAQYAQNAFSDAARTYGDPAAGAEAVLALDYLAGEVNTNPRWSSVSVATKAELLQARQDTRAAAGIAPNAPSQLVVNSLLAARNDLTAGNPDAAAAALNNPAFPGGGQAAVKALANLPYIQTANVATIHAANEMDSPGEGDSAPFQP